MKPLPNGCFKFIDHERIIQHDINNNRPSDQTNISTEKVIGNGYQIKTVFSRVVVYSIITYEMAGDYRHTYMGGRCWAETDHSGLEWSFHKETDANIFFNTLITENFKD